MRNCRGKIRLDVNKAVFLDRDGTINIEKNYLYQIEEFEFIPGAVEGLKLLQGAGFILIIVTNQSGIGRGYYTEAEFHKLNNWMLDELKGMGIDIAKVYYCPHLPDATIDKYKMECNCRKPKIGMYEKAALEFDIDFDISWVIGDKIRDCAISEKRGCKGILIGNSEKKEIIDRVMCGEVEGIIYKENLYIAARSIVEDKG